MDYRRTHYCHELRGSHVGEKVSLSGWVYKRRDHGGVIFIDLRDRFGITQLVFDPKMFQSVHAMASKLRSEWVVTVKGKVRARGEGLANAKLATGEIEVEVETFQILSKSKPSPIAMSDTMIETSEEVRLKYRYLDMRRNDLSEKLVMRHKAMLNTRQFFDSQGFIEINTPILGRSTPEGARDYLVPSRIYPGNFYALPQSPQIFKQLLMIGGMDRYFQIAPCFRDEDLRSDRQPEFTQIDMEMSFGYPEDIRAIINQYFQHLFKVCINYDVPTSIPVMTYDDCMEYYGTDRPDLRFDMPLVRVDDIVKRSTFPLFNDHIQKGGCVKALCVQGGIDLSRKELERYVQFVKDLGLYDLIWMKYHQDGLRSSAVKFFSHEEQEDLKRVLRANKGDLLLFATAESESMVNRSLDHLRRLIARERGLIPPDTFAFLWVIDFPLFEWDITEKRLRSAHHPFTSPHFDDISLFDVDPLKMRSYAYDVIINGYEVGGGSQRIHDFSIQEKVFEILSFSKEKINKSFGFLIEALQYGAPPHLGIALGLDRIVMLLTKTENIRDVIAFPKTQKASDLMSCSPSVVSAMQLNELKIATKSKEIAWI